MFDQIQNLFNSYYEAARVNPFLTTLMLPLVGGLMWFLKGVPTAVWNTVVRNTTVTMSLNNTGWDGNNDAYNAFDRWFMMSGWQRFSRSFFMFRQYRENLFKDESYKPYRLGIGKGTHIFFYRGRLFWFTKGNLESSGSEKQKGRDCREDVGF